MPLVKLTFILDGEVYRSDDREVGTPIVPPVVPEREGYDFSGWKNLPPVMPEEALTVEGSYTPDSFTLTEVVDDEVWKTFSFSSGEDISGLPLPKKKGYTFSGWAKKYKKMPKSNLTLRGSFKVNSYRLTFEIDGMVFERMVDYGTPLDYIIEPERDNYTFSGWGKVPETMPDRDLHFKGSFRVNSHTLTFRLDGETLHTEQLSYGAPIKAPTVASREGYIFSGWRGLPKTMPNRDVTIEGKYHQKKCKVNFMVGAKKYAWVSLAEGAVITPPDPPVVRGSVFRGWQDLPETMPAHDLTVQAIFDEEA